MIKKKVICIIQRKISDILSLMILAKDPHVSIELVIVESNNPNIEPIYDVLDWLFSRYTRIRIYVPSEKSESYSKTSCYNDEFSLESVKEIFKSIPTSSRLKYSPPKLAMDDELGFYLNLIGKHESATIFDFGSEYFKNNYMNLDRDQLRKIRRIFTLGPEIIQIDTWKIMCCLLYKPPQISNLIKNSLTLEGQIFGQLMNLIRDKDLCRNIICIMLYLDYIEVKPKIKRYDYINFVKRFDDDIMKSKIFYRLSKAHKSGGTIESRISKPLPYIKYLFYFLVILFIIIFILFSLYCQISKTL